MTTPSVFRSGATALITGGASGVGLAIAKLCASHVMNVIIVDISNDSLTKAKDTLQASGAQSVHSLQGDVSSQASLAQIDATIREQYRLTIDLLVLNAGIGPKGTWTDADYFHRTMDTNLFGIIHGLTTFLPHLDNNTNSTHPKSIVITGSKQGITNPPGNPAYNASKAAVKSLAEHLSFDLTKSAPATSVHLLVPGWTFTGLTGGGGTKMKPEGAWTPEQVADHLFEKMGQGKFYVICPDNDVDWETDRKRMMWTAGDAVFERQPMSRWREEYKDEAGRTMEGMRLGEKQ